MARDILDYATKAITFEGMDVWIAWSYAAGTVEFRTITGRIKGHTTTFQVDVACTDNMVERVSGEVSWITRSTFSTTTMASSTRRPMASTMANMVSVLIE